MVVQNVESVSLLKYLRYKVSFEVNNLSIALYLSRFLTHSMDALNQTRSVPVAYYLNSDIVASSNPGRVSTFTFRLISIGKV